MAPAAPRGLLCLLVIMAACCLAVVGAEKDTLTKEQVVEEIVEDVKKTITTIFTPMVQFSLLVLLATLLCIQFEVGLDATRLGSKPSLKGD